jgi:hypothetical protein
MKRKIEKYIAAKKGVDEKAVKPGSDGRYEIKNDIFGALAAVRGNEVMRSNRLSVDSVVSSEVSSSSGKKKSTSSVKRAIHMGNVPASAGAAHQAHPYFPYYAGGFPPHLYPPAAMMAMHGGKENSAGQFPHVPPYWAHFMTPGANPASFMDSKNNLDGSFAASAQQHHPMMYPGHAPPEISAATKSIFDSPPKNYLNRMSKIDINDMTPPDSDLKDTFATPLASKVESAMSHEEAFSLNKSLFSEAVVSTPFDSKSPRRAVEEIRLSIGDDERLNDSISGLVSISPIYANAGSIKYFAESDDGTNESNKKRDANDIDLMPPPMTAPRTAKSVEFQSLSNTPSTKRKLDEFSPFDSCKMARRMTQTPSTAKTESLEDSFWSTMTSPGGTMSPAPLSPFGSPTFKILPAELTASTVKKPQKPARKVKLDDDPLS